MNTSHKIIHINSKCLDDSDAKKILINAFEQIKSTNRILSNSLLLSLSEKSIYVAKSLFLNVFEVNRIAIAYLNIWHKENLYSSITPQFFVKQFPVTTEGIISSFFPINSIPFHSFFVFLCIFLFYDNELVFSLLLTLSNVYSNKLISVDQIKDFIHLYKLDDRLLNCIIINHFNKEEEVFPPNTIGLKEFKQMCYVDPSYIMAITSLKDSLKSLCFCNNEYIEIHKRFTYYYTNPCQATDRCTILPNALNKIPEMSDVEYLNSINIYKCGNKGKRKSNKIIDANYINYKQNTEIILNTDVSDESCWSRIDRKYFHYRLPPYYYDYGVEHPNYSNLEEVILMARKIYGYSIRLNRTSRYNSKEVIVCDVFDNNDS